jgi:hypothetical protein
MQEDRAPILSSSDLIGVEDRIAKEDSKLADAINCYGKYTARNVVD